jgi:hypothetical protein
VPEVRAAQVAEAPVRVRVPARVPGAQVVEAPVPLAELLVMAAEVAQAVQVLPAEAAPPEQLARGLAVALPT